MENLSNRFALRTKFLITSFRNGTGIPGKNVVEVQVDGAPAIGHEEKSRASDQPQPVSPGRNDHPVRIWVEIRISNAMACICSKRI